MFEVGDDVKIKENLKVGDRYQCDDIIISVTESMEQYFGKLARVTDIFFNGVYCLNIDNEKWFWAKDMLLKSNPQEEERNLLMNELEKKIQEIEEIVKKLK